MQLFVFMTLVGRTSGSIAAASSSARAAAGRAVGTRFKWSRYPDIASFPQFLNHLILVRLIAFDALDLRIVKEKLRSVTMEYILQYCYLRRINYQCTECSTFSIRQWRSRGVWWKLPPPPQTQKKLQRTKNSLRLRQKWASKSDDNLKYFEFFF